MKNSAIPFLLTLTSYRTLVTATLEKYLPCIAIFCCFVQTSSSQSNEDICWHLQTSGTSNNLNSVYFIDNQTGWAVGNAGTIRHTTDGGLTWYGQTSGTSQRLASVFFTDSLNGLVVGDNGTIRKTTNGGLSWQAKSSGTGYDLYSIFFINSQIGWAVGQNGIMRKTWNRGDSWQGLPSGTPNNLTEIYFINSDTGWVVGTSFDGNTSIRQSSNGGASWQPQSSGLSFPYPFLSSVSFTDSQNGWAVGGFFYNTILHTDDGGANWQVQLKDTVAGGLSSVYFIDSQTGWAVGHYGTILHTINGGDTWEVQSFGKTNALSSVNFTDSLNGWAVGLYGAILKYGAVSLPSAGFHWSGDGVGVQFSNTSNNAATFFWEFGDGQTSQEKNPFHTYDTLGAYTVKLTVANGCGSTSTFEQTIGVTVGISTPEFFKAFEIYPNPAADYFTLQLKGEPQNILHVELFNSAGQSVLRETGDFQSGSLLKNYSCRHLPEGLYFLNVRTATGTVVAKVSVQR